MRRHQAFIACPRTMVLNGWVELFDGTLDIKFDNLNFVAWQLRLNCSGENSHFWRL
jgi:hypothetical protein